MRGMAMFKHILCPVDFSPYSRAALTVANELANSSNATLTIAHVWELSPYVAPGLMSGGDAIATMLADAERLLAEWSASTMTAGTTTQSTLVRGVPWAEIVQLLQGDRGYDLAVMGTHGRTGLKHVLVGSVAERVVRHAPCAVLVVR
jgi:universal stress protein A